MDNGEQTDPKVVGADRVLAVLVELAKHPSGITLDEMTTRFPGSKTTVHRALGALRRAGLADQMARGVYSLSDEFLRLAFRNYAGRPDAALIEPILQELARRFGETAHYAVLDGMEVVYRAKVDPPEGSVRLTSEIGGRNPAHRTGVGKMLLSAVVRSEKELRERLAGADFSARTPNTITSISELWTELQLTRQRGYAVDNQENELGVNCIAVPVRLDPELRPIGAVSVSALAFRTPLAQLVAEVGAIQSLIADAHLSSLA